ncbi:hypothetical protein CCHR01_12656 [Colletotrichum chrysophilum]|uniref:Uncharacterized protein n=1 Tax=Colletotrichum chrysophilum TaxID=1836956 RepID=A0AAD9EDY2_9PEZI|nr:hypothetical protein CCHR01_12656 [Colletotrichum chrysophilum]
MSGRESPKRMQAQPRHRGIGFLEHDRRWSVVSVRQMETQSQALFNQSCEG